MGGVEPRLIITDECASMKAAISVDFPTSTHRLCMWHIMRKLKDKVGYPLREDKEFLDRFNKCVWCTETDEEFEAQWTSIISDYGLEDHEWLTTRYRIRESWIPVYFKDISLAGILRTTSRSESTNSFFCHFIGFKLALVEFSLRFDTALEEQRHKELENNNVTVHSNQKLKTEWGFEKHGREVFTHEIFDTFQKEVVAVMEKCIVENIEIEGDVKITTVSDSSLRERKVLYNTSTKDISCTCMLFESLGIPCRHVILVLRSARLNQLPEHLVLRRWTKMCKKEPVFDSEGTLLEESESTSTDPMMKKLVFDVFNTMEETIHLAKQSIDSMQLLKNGVLDIAKQVRQMVPATQRTRVSEIEEFLGCSIPTQIDIHPPNDVQAKGKSFG
ncbi:protein FAR1-RELATED SEQUENCE 5-like [Oryza glaberrima]|uniref:protein FAR1-RELATED SEQUENCE 5-like n=1 Tax=Oryza glaberrima TaxID=4538 RepID=UPI00224C4E7E|nr:protein FAR1-RELATED SEQUENCE 5-like [Oryza glaberrima]